MSMYMHSNKTRTLLTEDVKAPIKNSTKNNNSFMPSTSFTMAGSSKGYVLGKGTKSCTTNNPSRMQGGQGRPNYTNAKTISKSFSTTPLNTEVKSPLEKYPNRFSNPKETLNKTRPSYEAKSVTKSSTDSKAPITKSPSQSKQRPNNPRLVPQQPIVTRNQGGRPSEARLLTKSANTLDSVGRSREDAKHNRFQPSKKEPNQSKIWNRNPPPAKPKRIYSKSPKDASSDMGLKQKVKTGTDFCTQVNELEVMNPDLIVGDIKLMNPSRELVLLIENDRHQKRLARLLKAERKFEPHALEEKEHLTDLKEFLESSSIKKRPRQRKTIDQLEEDRRMIGSMDEMFKKPLPKPESITDITKRIKRKEEELLSMFDKFYKLKIPGVTSKFDESEE